MTTFAIFTSPVASGPTRRPRPTIRGARNSATRSVCWIANVFGVTSAKTKSNTVIASVAMISPAPWNTRTASEVAIVVPPIVESNTRRSTTLRNGAGLSAILTSDVGTPPALLLEPVRADAVGSGDRDLGRTQHRDHGDQHDHDRQLEPVTTAHGTCIPE